MSKSTTTPDLGIPLLDHPQFTQHNDTLWRIRLAAHALHGVGILMQPQRIVADEVLDYVQRAEVAHVLEFFGAVLRAEADTALGSHDALEMVMHQQKITFQPTQGV